MASTASTRAFSRLPLLIYDVGVLRFSNTFAWRCPRRRILDFYNEHVSAHHLDVGPGSGYYLDRCRWPAEPVITLLDLNPAPLQMTAQRIARYAPRTIQTDVLQPIATDERFDSIGISYVLHCLPGTMSDKAAAFANLKKLLRPGGVLFGTTILGKGVPHNALARYLLRTYNTSGIFSNTEDSQGALEHVLGEQFGRHTVQIHGCVALFAGYA